MINEGLRQIFSQFSLDFRVIKQLTVMNMAIKPFGQHETDFLLIEMIGMKQELSLVIYLRLQLTDRMLNMQHKIWMKICCSH